MKEIIISILTYNKLEYTKRCIDSIFKTPKHTTPYSVVVSDNGSTDRTLDYLKGLSNIQLIENGENLGFSKAHNKIMKMFPDRDVVLLNNDIELPFKWLPTLNHCVYKRNLGAVSPAIKVPDGLDVGAVLDASAKGQSIINGNAKPDWITGSCLYIRRSTIDSIGYLDEKYQFYYEDVDYCKKMTEIGIKFECIRDVVVVHHNSVSSSPFQKKQMMEASRKYFAKKWGYRA